MGRAPQYYNAPSYNQGGYGYNNGGYRQQRPMRQQQRGYNNGYNQRRGYNQRGYGQQQQQRQQRRNNFNKSGGNVQAGTGAYLDNARVRGDEIDIKDQQDFDFGAAKNEFDLDDADKNAAHGLIVGKVESKDKGDDEAVDDEETKQGDDEVSDEKKVKYDASKSFFDGLETETKRSKPRSDLQTQKDVDADTFGSVGATYKSRHIQNRGRRYQNNQYQNGNNNQYRSYNNSRKQSQYAKPKQQQQSSQSNGYVAYGGNRWVKRG